MASIYLRNRQCAAVLRSFVLSRRKNVREVDRSFPHLHFMVASLDYYALRLLFLPSIVRSKTEF